MRERGEPAYRARQVYAWLYAKRVRGIEAMSDLGRGLRDRLLAEFELRWPTVAQRQRASDGTIKYLFRLDDGATIESVYIPEERRRTICLSTQAGCPLACGFCLTGVSGYKRNLKPWEILGQVATLMEEHGREDRPRTKGSEASLDAERGPRREPGERDHGDPQISDARWNIVVMGMGEPLLNYDNTLAALRVLMDPEGFAVPPRRLTLSTVGILPALEKLMRERVRPNLAISLHAPNPELRRRLMPIEEKYALADVLDAARRYPVPSGGRVTFEYVLLRGVNDSRVHARELARLLGGFPGKVNLIPLNPTPEIPFDAPDAPAVEAFRAVLSEARIAVSVRRPRGQDILAACGQLHFRREAPLLASAS